MSKDNLGMLYDDNVASVLKEQGFHITESPRSVYKVDKLYESLAKYEPKNSPRIDVKDEHFKQGVNLAYACFARPKDVNFLDLKDFTPKLVYDITSNHKGSAGLTAWGQTKSESYVRAYERGLQQIRHEKFPEPCIAFKRTQFNDKTRLVWGYPYAMTALEGIFARPLINWFKRMNTPMAFGKSTGILGSNLRVSSYHKKYAYSTDVSSFDSSIGAYLISESFKILSTWFDLDHIEPTSNVSYQSIWDDIVYYFIHTPIVMPDGNVYKGKRHGVPSGSYFTQMIDSVVNVILIGTISSKFNLSIDKKDIYVLGDDILFWSNYFVPLDKIAKFATNFFHMKFNESKSSLFQWYEPIHFLGRVWTKGIPSIDEDEIIIRMTQPESFRKYPKDDEKRKRQVRLLLLSYAAVYREAYPIYMKCMDVRPRYDRSNMSIENFVYGMDYRNNDINEDYLSGLMRYRKKYIIEDGRRSIKPLALQFWK